ncbi:MAG: ATP synthase F1 subunit delta [Sediminibacterium sp.]|nr:ATP synthase F1 subunit delta [Sediminibacterium sp.]
MGKEIIAQRYAQCLFELASDSNNLDVIFKDCTVTLALETNALFTTFLANPIISSEKKKIIIQETLKSVVSPKFLEFLLFLTVKKREYLMFTIAANFQNNYNLKKGRKKCQLILAENLNVDVENKISQKLKTTFQCTELILETKIDESIIGGFLLEFDNQQVDATIKRDLNDIKKQFHKNEFIHQIK